MGELTYTRLKTSVRIFLIVTVLTGLEIDILPVIVVVVEIVLGILTVKEGLVTKVEKERGKFATLTLRLLLVTKVEIVLGILTLM